MPIRVGHKCNRNEHQVECSGGQGDSFPSPITMAHQSRVQDDQRNEDRHPRRNAKETQPRTYGDELSDKSEEVSNGQVDHRKPTPERPEAVEDQFGVSSVSGGTETHSHLLHNNGHAERENDERNKKSDAKLRPRG